MKIKVVLGGTLDYLFPAHGDDPCGSLWIPVDLLCPCPAALLSLGGCSSSEQQQGFTLYPEPSASGIPIGFPAAGKEQEDELLWKSYFREGKKALPVSLFNCNVISGTDIHGNAGAVLHSQLLVMGFCRLGWL